MNNVQLKVGWKCRKCSCVNELTVTRRDIDQQDMALTQKCLECKCELRLALSGTQFEPKW